jgi:hypothetical protein
MPHIGNGPPTWTAAAPHSVVKHFLAGDEQRAWRAWKKRLVRRKSPWADTPLATFAAAELLQWGCSDEQLDASARTAIEALFEQDRIPPEGWERAVDAVFTDGGTPFDEQT